MFHNISNVDRARFLACKYIISGNNESYNLDHNNCVGIIFNIYKNLNFNKINLIICPKLHFFNEVHFPVF